MDEASGQLCLLQYRSIFLQTDSIKVENLLFSAVSFSHRKRQKQQPDGTCLLHSFIISSTWCTMVSAHSDLAAFTWSFKMQNYRLGAKRWPWRLSSTVLIVTPSALPDGHSWQYNYCSVGRDIKRCCLFILPPTEHPAAPHGLVRCKKMVTGPQKSESNYAQIY